MVHDADNKAIMEKSDSCHDTREDLALLMTPTKSDLKYTTADRPLVLNKMCETLIIVPRKEIVLIEVVLEENGGGRNIMCARRLNVSWMFTRPFDFHYDRNSWWS